MNESKILVEINDLEHGVELIEAQKYALLLNVKDVSYTKQFNCYTNELKLLSDKARENGVDLYANLDMLFHEEDLIGLKAILKRLHKMSFKGLVILDIGVIELANELGLEFEFINGGTILNTNYASMNVSDSYYNGFILSNEINIEEINKIIEQTNTKLIIQVYGKKRIFLSKRKLLTSYFEHYELPKRDFHPRNHLVISDQNEKDNFSYIYEDDFGTYVYTFFAVDGLDYIRDFQKKQVALLYVSNLFIDKESYNKVILAYYNYLNELASYDETRKIIENNTDYLAKSFFEDASVYTIEQAKLLEEGLRNE